ncbi:hypothetical protein SCHPADRAFT_947435 [Schizopora paradoxa]|uniref:Uncharacterized protein n=1 Tax=Schizopora paradoxa TaxID=27342 RepID=A0A0H2QZH4_9AGAM|nr:hypothetical protein SCHPADRAFT_947435 [Schizopora paradoxa]
MSNETDVIDGLFKYANHLESQFLELPVEQVGHHDQTGAQTVVQGRLEAMKDMKAGIVGREREAASRKANKKVKELDAEILEFITKQNPNAK